MINFINSNTNSPTFGANLNSPRLRYSQKDFFIRIRGFGQNKAWAKEIIKVADAAVYLMQHKVDPESVLKQITLGVTSANKIPLDINKRLRTGILRAPRDDWESTEDYRNLKTCYTTGRYKIYEKRLDSIIKKPLETPYQDIAMSHLIFGDIYHCGAEFVNNSLNIVFELSKKVFPRFTKKGVPERKLDEVNNIIAEIRWLLAHATPWLRGSDAISNVFMRAMYKAIGVKTYPPAKGISFDLEAYCRNLDDYKTNFTSFFEKPPCVMG